MKSRIMYIECKGNTLNGTARVGRVTWSASGKTIYYRAQAFQSLGGGYKANYFDVETGEEYWISGCKKNGRDRLYASALPIEIDEDAREEYWTEIRKLPELKSQPSYRSV